MADYRPRLSIELSDEQRKKLSLYFPHGTLKLVFTLLIDDLLDMIEEFGAGPVIGSFIDREITVKDVLKWQQSTTSKDQ